MAKPTVTIDLELYKLGGVERVREMIRREKESHGAGIEVGPFCVPHSYCLVWLVLLDLSWPSNFPP